MKIIACSLLLFAASAIFGRAETPPKAPVGVYVEYDHPVPENLVFALQNEVREVLSPLGFDIQWRPVNTAGREVWADLALVSFRGICDFDGNLFGKFEEGALGWTHVSNGAIQSFIEIDCNRIGALLQTQISPQPARNHERVFGRAIARVLTHELYHVFARTAVHKDSGVGKAEFTVADLLAGHFQFHTEQARALRNISLEDVRHFYPTQK